MTKVVFVLFCILLVTFAHKDRKDQINSIYKPFEDVPIPYNDAIQVQDAQIQIDSHEEISQDRQKQYQQFNQLLGYGLIAGTILLACMLMKTCSAPRRNPHPINMMQRAQPLQGQPPVAQNTYHINEIRNKIAWHQNEILRLQEASRQYDLVMEQRAIQQSIKEKKIAEEKARVHYNQMEMQQKIEPRPYSQRLYYQQNAFENIPMGRPIPRDNDSSFASEYPTI